MSDIGKGICLSRPLRYSSTPDGGENPKQFSSFVTTARQQLNSGELVVGSGVFKHTMSTTLSTSSVCDRCGRTRPTDPERLIITFHDRGGATHADERVFVCGDCWNRLRELSHEVVR